MSDITERSREWPCDMTVASAAVERALAPIVLREGEFGRGRDLPQHRLDEIDAACAEHGMHPHQALSLRRQLLRAKPGGMGPRVTHSMVGLYKSN